MTASELKVRTAAAVQSKKTIIPSDLEYQMKRAADNGSYYCHWYFSLSPQCKEVLEEQGFEVEVISGSKDNYKISWK